MIWILLQISRRIQQLKIFENRSAFFKLINECTVAQFFTETRCTSLAVRLSTEMTMTVCQQMTIKKYAHLLRQWHREIPEVPDFPEYPDSRDFQVDREIQYCLCSHVDPELQEVRVHQCFQGRPESRSDLTNCNIIICVLYVDKVK